MWNFSTIPKSCNVYNINSTIVSPIYTFSLAGNIIVYTPIQGTNREKYFNSIICKAKMPTLAGNKHNSIYFPRHKLRLFHLSTEKFTGIVRQKWTSKWLFLRQHNRY